MKPEIVLPEKGESLAQHHPLVWEVVLTIPLSQEVGKSWVRGTERARKPNLVIHQTVIAHHMPATGVSKTDTASALRACSPIFSSFVTPGLYKQTSVRAQTDGASINGHLISRGNMPRGITVVIISKGVPNHHGTDNYQSCSTERKCETTGDFKMSIGCILKSEK